MTTPTTGPLVPVTPRPLEGAVELAAERTDGAPAPMVWIPGDGRTIVLSRDDLPPAYFPEPYQPRDLAPQPVVDPVAQRIVASGAAVGLGGAGLGWGLGQALAGIAAFSGSGTVLGALVGLLLARACGPSTTVHHHETHTHHTRGLFARSSVTTTGGGR